MKTIHKLSGRTQVTLPEEPSNILLTLTNHNKCGYPTCIEMSQFGTLTNKNTMCGLQLGCQNGSSIPVGVHTLKYHNFINITTGCNTYDRHHVGTFDMRKLLHKGHNIISLSTGCTDTVGTLTITYNEPNINNDTTLFALLGILLVSLVVIRKW